MDRSIDLNTYFSAFYGRSFACIEEEEMLALDAEKVFDITYHLIGATIYYG